MRNILLRFHSLVTKIEDFINYLLPNICIFVVLTRFSIKIELQMYIKKTF